MKHAPEKLGEKKEKMAKKMFKRTAPKDTVEGDYSKHFGPQDKFSEKDEAKEKKTRKDKHSKMPKSNYEI